MYSRLLQEVVPPPLDPLPSPVDWMSTAELSGSNFMPLLSKNWKSKLSVERIVRRLDDLAVTDVLSWPLRMLDPCGARFEPVEPAVAYKSNLVELPEGDVDGLSVMTWNIKFGGGRVDFWYDGHGERVHLKQWEVFEHLEGIAEKIRRVDPDILLLQEVDVDSRRTNRIDQMQWLLDNTDLNFGAYASQWRCRYVPAKRLGRVNMGIAIMSKYPIDDARRLALPQMEALDPVTRYFYLKRAVLTACIDVPGAAPVRAVNVHTEAFSMDDTKKRHIDLFKAELDRIDAAGGLVVGGGDLNTLPPQSDRTGRFRDTAEDRDLMFEGSDDFSEERDWLKPLYRRYTPAVEMSGYRDDHRPYCTFSATDDVFWCRKLDYLFTNGQFVDGSALTHQDARTGGIEMMPLSDHAPISAVLVHPAG